MISLKNQRNLLGILLTTLLSSAVYAGNNATGGYRVTSYLGLGDDSRLVMVDGGKRDGVVTGEVFRMVRPAGSGMAGRDAGVPVETGSAKAVMVYDHKTIAEITQQSTPISRQLYPKFAEVMAGDLAVPQRLEIRPAQAMAPDVVLTYKDLFEDPKANPGSFELLSSGRDAIAGAIVELARLRAGTLMVIGHTDSKGTTEADQVESYQRAVVVRQHLIDQLGFDPKRVVAIGKGKDELPEETLTPGFSERARRIVLKVVPMASGE